MRDILLGKSRNYNSQKHLRAARPPVSWQVGTPSGSAAQRDLSLSREKRVHRAWYSAVPEGWDVGVPPPNNCAPLHNYANVASAQISLLLVCVYGLSRGFALPKPIFCFKL